MDGWTAGGQNDLDLSPDYGRGWVTLSNTGHGDGLSRHPLVDQVRTDGEVGSIWNRQAER